MSECRWCGNEHDVKDLCKARRVSRRTFCFALGVSALALALPGSSLSRVEGYDPGSGNWHPLGYFIDWASKEDRTAIVEFYDGTRVKLKCFGNPQMGAMISSMGNGAVIAPVHLRIPIDG